MPIYAYKCSDCGFEQDVMQKVSDAPLTDCPSCGKPTFAKQLTAAGFQLKGSGWYATDFKGGAPKKEEAPAPACGAGGCPACAA
ncbi:MAG: FmdB family zinc ribbon protein [Thiobacillaceae bacterium]